MFRSHEQEELYTRISKHIIGPSTFPLLMEGGTGIGKTRAYLAAIADSSKRVSIILPSHALINQLLESKDLEACGITDIRSFRPKSYFFKKYAELLEHADKDDLKKIKLAILNEWKQHKEDALNARIMVCTSASVIIDSKSDGDYNGSSQRDVLIFDEADQLPSMAALQSDLTITAGDLEGYGITTKDAKQAATEVIKHKDAESEHRAIASQILWAIDNPRWYRIPGFQAENLVLFHKLPGRMLKAISNSPRAVFVSATLSSGMGGFDNFKRALGIERHSNLSAQVEPEKHGKIQFKTYDINGRDDHDEMVRAAVEEIKAAVLPCLVVTPSHDLSDEIKEAIGDMEGVTVKAGAWAGMDMKSEPRTIIVPRVPFSPPVQVDNQQLTRYLDSKVEAQRRMKQVIGRGIRTPHSDCTVVIIDSRIDSLDGWLPARFVRAWKNRELTALAEA